MGRISSSTSLIESCRATSHEASLVEEFPIDNHANLWTTSRTLELSFNSNEYSRVLLVIPSMFGKLEVHASEVVWRFEPITFHIGELRV